MPDSGAHTQKRPDNGTLAADFHQHIPRILESIPEAVLAMAFDGTVIYWNPAAERLYGWSREDILGNSVLVLSATEEARTRTMRTLGLMRERREWTYEIEIVRKDGINFPAQLALSQLTDTDGQAIGMVCVTTDITPRKRTEQRLAIQYAVSSLLSGATTLESVGKELLQVICTELEWDWCALWVIDSSRDLLCPVAVWHPADNNFAAFAEATYKLTFPSGIGLPGRTWKAEEPVWIVDYGIDLHFIARTPEITTGIQSAMAVPIRLDVREVRGVIEFMSQTRLKRDDDVLDMAAAAARQIGQFLERQQATELLRENEIRLQRLEDSNLIGTIRAGLDGTITAANDAFLDMLGYTRGDLASGLRWDDMTPEEWRHVDTEINDDIRTTGRSFQKEKEFLHKDGSRVAVLLGSAQLYPHAEEVASFVIDITLQKHAEHERELSLQREQAARIEASDSLKRAERLLEVSAAYSNARTPDEVVKITVDRGIAALGADAGLIVLLDESQNYLSLAASSGYAPETLAYWEGPPKPRTSDRPLSDATLKQEAIWIESQAELFERYPDARSTPALYAKGMVAIPLVSSGDVLGALGISYATVHSFSPAERVFAETLGRFCAYALERTRIFSAEQRARQEASASQGRAERLLEVTAALSRALTPLEVAEVAIEQGLGALEVDAGLVALLIDDGTGLDVVHSRGYPQEVVNRWNNATIPIDRPVPIADAALRGEPVWIPSQDELFTRYPMMAERSLVYSNAFAALPLIAGSRVYGVLGLSYQTVRALDLAERTYARTLARLCSQAIERANLFSRERDVRMDAEEARDQLTLLAEAGELLASSLDMTTILSWLATLIVPRMADWCAIDVLNEQGLPDRVTVLHSDPKKIRWAEDVQKQLPFDPDALVGLPNVLRTGQPEFFPDITDDMAAAAARDEEYSDLLRSVGFSALLIVPMIARGHTVGAITLVYTESGRHYEQVDLVLIEDVAHRAALAIDNARLYEQSLHHGERMDTIAALSRSFAEASLDQTTVLTTLSTHVAQTIGEWAIIRLRSDDGEWLEPVAFHHPDPDSEAALRQIFDLNPLRWGEGIIGRVAATGESLLLTGINQDVLVQRTRPEYHPLLERHSTFHMLIVPMRRFRRVIGTVALVRNGSSRPYSEEDRLHVEDVADRAALALENAKLYDQAQEAIRLREEFLSIASHEMRTPLTTITGFAHLLNRQVTRDQIDPERFKTITRRLIGEAERLDQLVGDLLDVSRIQQGRMDIRSEPCDLSLIVYDVADRLDQAQEPGMHREIVVDTRGEVLGIWDPARIDQIVTNLLSNALKYSTDGAITLIVTVADDDTAVLKVSDQGIGIPPEQQATLFEPFIRGEAAHHVSSGTGLGLFITKQIAERHGGSIAFESEPGCGTTFTVRLPRHMNFDDE